MERSIDLARLRSTLDGLPAPDMLCTADSPLKDASFQLFRYTVRPHQPRSGQSARHKLSDGRSPAATPQCSPINTTPHHVIADPRTHTFPDTARRDALYEPTNLTNLLRHHEHGRAEGGRERRRGGEEAKPEPRKSDSHGGRFGEEDLYRRMRTRQAVS